MPISLYVEMRAQIYFDICKKHERSLKKIITELDIYEQHTYHDPEDESSTLVLSDEQGQRYMYLQEIYKEHEISVIVFAAMTLEALINDYGIIKSTKNYFENYLDGMNIRAKWIVIPRIFIGKEIPSNSEAIRMLGNLISARNRLVHSKSRKMIIETGPDESIKSKPFNFRDIAQQAVRTVNLLIEELRKIDSSFPKGLILK